MGALAWLGLKDADDSHLSQIQEAVRAVLPDDEGVVIRYIVIVAVLLTRVAYADGRLHRAEHDHLRGLLSRIERLPQDGIECLCETLSEHVPQLTPAELKSCYRELKSLCDAKERRRVMRLLARLATVDGVVAEAERAELLAIGTALGISEEATDQAVRRAEAS